MRRGRGRKAMARQASAANWQVKALVEATPISGAPPGSAALHPISRAMVEVLTLTTEAMRWPPALQ